MLTSQSIIFIQTANICLIFSSSVSKYTSLSLMYQISWYLWVYFLYIWIEFDNLQNLNIVNNFEYQTNWKLDYISYQMLKSQANILLCLPLNVYIY